MSEQVLSDEEILRIASESSPELVWMIKGDVVAGEFRRAMTAICRAVENEVMGRCAASPAEAHKDQVASFKEAFHAVAHGDASYDEAVQAGLKAAIGALAPPVSRDDVLEEVATYIEAQIDCTRKHDYVEIIRAMKSTKEKSNE